MILGPSTLDALQQQTDLLALSIVVPCFNEETGLSELIRRCSESAESGGRQGL